MAAVTAAVMEVDITAVVIMAPTVCVSVVETTVPSGSFSVHTPPLTTAVLHVSVQFPGRGVPGAVSAVRPP